ncbi:MAG: M48 family metallopeptidase [Oscillatoriales cyanobacterium SM2_2_1]|nr:M48 family metallopeptidase [Oscillatoriales cyanobacterium SM2_2_1]
MPRWEHLDYGVRVSQRARYPRLVVLPCRGLEVVVPLGYPTQQIPQLLERKRAWLQRAMGEESGTGALFREIPRVPEVLELRAIAQQWRVVNANDFRDGGGSLCLTLPQCCITLIQQREFIRRWLLKRAEEYLIPWLRRLEAAEGLSCGQVRVRWQKTLWGSCSMRRNISLNGKLLFLPKDVVRYVLIHELCHTVHLNHSAKFWQLVSRHEPDYQRCDRVLREAVQWVPPLFLGD